MLVVNPEQVRQLGQAADALFLSQVAVQVAAYWPRRVERLGPEALMDRLRSVYAVALDVGVQERPDVLRLANVAMALEDGLGVDTPHGWVREVLGQTGLRPSDRLDVLDAEVREWLLERRAEV